MKKASSRRQSCSSESKTDQSEKLVQERGCKKSVNGRGFLHYSSFPLPPFTGDIKAAVVMLSAQALLDIQRERESK